MLWLLNHCFAEPWCIGLQLVLNRLDTSSYSEDIEVEPVSSPFSPKNRVSLFKPNHFVEFELGRPNPNFYVHPPLFSQISGLAGSTQFRCQNSIQAYELIQPGLIFFKTLCHGWRRPQEKVSDSLNFFSEFLFPNFVLLCSFLGLWSVTKNSML